MAKPVTINDVVYESVSVAAKQLKIGVGAIYRRIVAQKSRVIAVNIEAVRYSSRYTAERMGRNNGIPVIVNGTEYKSKVLAAEAMGCSWNTVHRAVVKQGSTTITVKVENYGRLSKSSQVGRPKLGDQGELRRLFEELLGRKVLPGYAPQFEASVVNLYGQLNSNFRAEAKVLLEGHELSHLIMDIKEVA